MAFFDTEMKGGQVVFGTSADTILIQDAIGEKVQRVQLLLFLYLLLPPFQITCRKYGCI